MPRDKTESHIRLMQAAKDEFREKGFEKASMRSIGRRCGMTAAGIYRHCRDKEDLFDQIVEPAVSRLERWMKQHVSVYIEQNNEDTGAMWHDSWIDMMRDVVYPHMDEYHLLLTGSHGTRYSDYLHELTERGQKQFLECLPLLREKGYSVMDIDPKELHILLSAYTAALFEPVIHCFKTADAMKYLDAIEVFFLPGWKQLIGF